MAKRTPRDNAELDLVEEASDESFPASDAPGWIDASISHRESAPGDAAPGVDPQAPDAGSADRPVTLADPDIRAALRLRRRQISDEELREFEGYVARIFTAFGLDPDTPATRDTPRRFVRALFDATSGYDGDPNLLTVFETECLGGPDCRLSQLVEGPIHFYGLCEHHALPIIGRAYVGYIAHEHIIGLSKLTRLVRLFARRFTVQERLGRQIADALEVMLRPHGVAVHVAAHHLCIQMRGVREEAPLTRNVFWRGAYDDNAALRAEFLTLCGQPGPT